MRSLTKATRLDAEALVRKGGYRGKGHPKKTRLRPSYAVARSPLLPKKPISRKNRPSRSLERLSRPRRTKPPRLRQIVAARAAKLAGGRHRIVARPTLRISLAAILREIKIYGRHSAYAPENTVRTVNRNAKKARRNFRKAAHIADRLEREAEWRDKADAREVNRQAREMDREAARKARAGAEAEAWRSAARGRYVSLSKPET